MLYVWVVQYMCLSIHNLLANLVLVLHPKNSMFSGYAPSNPHTIQTLNTWKEAALITIIFLLDCQRWAVCFTISCSPYLLLFPPMVIEGGCRPVKVRSEKGGVERKRDRNRGDRELLERAGFHSAEKHVHFSRNSVSVIPGLWTVLITGSQWINGNPHKGLGHLLVTSCSICVIFARQLILFFSILENLFCSYKFRCVFMHEGATVIFLKSAHI